MNTTTIKYGLLYIPENKILGVEREQNHGEFCCETCHTLSSFSDEMWLVDTEYNAVWVKNHSTEWYNADYANPQHDFKSQDLKVVKVTQTIEIEKLNAELPDDIELLRLRYEKKNPEHFKSLKKEIEKGVNIKLQMYDFEEFYKK